CAPDSAAIARHLLFEREDEFEEVNVELRGGGRFKKSVCGAGCSRVVNLFGRDRKEVRAADSAGQTRALVNFERDHQVETEEREIVQVVLRQLLAAQVRVDGAQAAEALRCDARALQVGPLDAARVADDDELDIAFTVNERADLPSRLVR